MDENNLIHENAKIYANIADMGVEEAAESLLQVMKAYKYNVDELDEVIVKLNKVYE